MAIERLTLNSDITEEFRKKVTCGATHNASCISSFCSMYRNVWVLMTIYGATALASASIALRKFNRPRLTAM
jgi:hypothetical protein